MLPGPPCPGFMIPVICLGVVSTPPASSDCPPPRSAIGPVRAERSPAPPSAPPRFRSTRLPASAHDVPGPSASGAVAPADGRRALGGGMGRHNNADLGDGPGQPPRSSRTGKNKSRERQDSDINRNHRTSPAWVIQYRVLLGYAPRNRASLCSKKLYRV